MSNLIGKVCIFVLAANGLALVLNKTLSVDAFAICVCILMLTSEIMDINKD